MAVQQYSEAGGKPAGRKEIPDKITLEEPRMKGPISVEEAIARRRSVRRFLDKPLSRQQISQLLWAAQGITDKARGYRAAPSAGATYPLTVFAMTPEGIYRYLPAGHELELVRKGDFRSPLARAALDQPWVAEAPLDIVITAEPRRTTGRYGRRGMMYIYMEAGHAAQNIHLQAVSLGLGSVPVGAFDDDRVADILQLPEGHSPLYIIPVGYPR
ncbi:MAG TPA: SagB/ThcOx family dehydrogenase [Lentisphaerae bacterium]|nr:SagB/ThcOx family dehydrogenase [Lentisphaerota bacterium]